MLTNVLDQIDRQKNEAIGRLKELLAIASVSTDPQYRDAMDQAATWVAEHLRASGLETKIHQTQGPPIVLAHGGPIDENLPHVLFYGHYDVQPPDPIDQWQTPAFEPTIRDGAVYARGASDDKGQVCSFLEALRAWKIAQGALPIRITVLIEGEEECGSNHLKPFLKKYASELKADVVLISDTTMWDSETVAITYGLRGLLYYDLKLHGPNRDLHSGMYGGVLANPATMLTQVLGKLFDDNHQVTIPGFYDDVLPIDEAEKKRWQALNFDEQKHCFGPLGVTEPFGEAGFTTLERKWARPACDINGLYGGYSGEGAKTVIPAMAGAKVSFRLAPDQDPHQIAQAFEAWIKSHNVHGCKWELTNHGEASPVRVADDSCYMDAVIAAIETSTAKPPVLVREGASIPVVSDFKNLLGLDSLLVGFGAVDDCIHSPNEKFGLSNFVLGSKTHAAMFWELSQLDNTKIKQADDVAV